MSFARRPIVVTAAVFAILSECFQIRTDSQIAHGSLARLLVIASDHGEGSSLLGHALGSHPCFINVGEPFGDDERWYSDTGKDALFARDGKRGQKETFSKLQSKLNDFFHHHGTPELRLDPKLHLKTKTLEKFFESVQKEACAHFHLNRSCQHRCILVHKMFPTYVSGDVSVARDYLLSSKTMVVQTLRDETAVIAANKRRSDMGEDAIDDLRKWNRFLDAMHKGVQGKKVWEIFNSVDDIFSNPFAYFEAVKRLYNKLAFEFVDANSMLELMKHGVEDAFSSYNAAKERYLERQHNVAKLTSNTTKTALFLRLTD